MREKKEREACWLCGDGERALSIWNDVLPPERTVTVTVRLAGALTVRSVIVRDGLWRDRERANSFAQRIRELVFLCTS